MFQEDVFNDSDISNVCRLCGCTEDNACEGGCYWAEPDLCSKCAENKEYKCQHEGCDKTGHALNYPGDEETVYFCTEHMKEEGFCWGCHYYSSGLGSFDFNKNGLCDDCMDNPDVTGNYPEDDQDDFNMDFYNEDVRFEP